MCRRCLRTLARHAAAAGDKSTACPGAVDMRCTLRLASRTCLQRCCERPPRPPPVPRRTATGPRPPLASRLACSPARLPCQAILRCSPPTADSSRAPSQKLRKRTALRLCCPLSRAPSAPTLPRCPSSPRAQHRPLHLVPAARRLAPAPPTPRAHVPAYLPPTLIRRRVANPQWLRLQPRASRCPRARACTPA